MSATLSLLCAQYRDEDALGRSRNFELIAIEIGERCDKIHEMGKSASNLLSIDAARVNLRFNLRPPTNAYCRRM